MKLRTMYVPGLVVLAAIATAAVLAYATIWQLAIFSVIPCVSGVLGIILTLVGLIVWLRTRTKEPPGLSRTGKGLFLVSVFFLLQGTYLPIGIGLRDREVDRAQDFIETLIPRLEEYERLHNTYPASVSAVLSGDEEVPRLLQMSGDTPHVYDNRRYYVQEGETYRFRFYLPDGWVGFQYKYCCGADGVWTVTD